MLSAINSLVNRFRVGMQRTVGRFGTLEQGWSDALDEIGGQLAAMTTESEGEFLRMGEKLQDIHLRVRGLSRLSGATAERLSDNAIASEMEGLRRIIQQIGDANDASLGGSATISLIMDRLQEARGQLEQFDKISMHLQLLCNLIRIESAHMGDRHEGFAALGDDVQKLIANAQSGLSTLMTRTRELHLIMADHLALSRAFETSQQEEATRILERSRLSIRKMEAQHDLSSRAVQDAALRWGNISKSVGEVVSSLQFHDITRQRIEHVREALVELMPKRENAAALPAPGRLALPWPHAGRENERKQETPELVSKAAATCELQVAQLEDARLDFSGAMGRIGQNLARISSEISILSEDIQKVAGISEEKENTYFSELETSLARMMEAIQKFTAMNQKMSVSMQQVANAVGDMTSLTRNIQKVGITMRITALNAGIHAAHIGSGGMALGVLADSIHRLSVDTERNIDAISANFEDIAGEAASLSRPGGRYDQTLLERQNQELTGQVGSLMQPLRQMDEELSALLRQFGSNGDELKQEIEEMAAHMKAHTGMDGEMGAAVTSLEAVANELKAVGRTSPGQTAVAPLGDVTARYTMEREREIHLALAAGTAVTATGAAFVPKVEAKEPETVAGVDSALFSVEDVQGVDSVLFSTAGEEANAPDPVIKTGDDEDLGDNIELF